MVSKTPWLETEGRRRLPYHRQRLAGALSGREARPASLLLQHRELRSRRCGRETQSRRPYTQARRRTFVFRRSGWHRMSGRECVIKPVGEPKRPRWSDAEEMPSIVPSATEVQEARELLRKYLRPTRLVRAESRGRRSEGQVRVKIESDLPTGWFKPRGALFALLTNAERGALAGVVAASTGNHGAAVAYAARIVNLAATIFLPENPNPVKRAHILGLGAKIVERGAADQLAAIEAARVF